MPDYDWSISKGLGAYLWRETCMRGRRRLCTLLTVQRMHQRRDGRMYGSEAKGEEVDV